MILLDDRITAQLNESKGGIKAENQQYVDEHPELRGISSSRNTWMPTVKTVTIERSQLVLTEMMVLTEINDYINSQELLISL